MPFKDPVYRKYRARCRRRKSKYGHWRQIYYDQSGICFDCGTPFDLEFHEEWGRESLMNSENFIKLKCIRCHSEDHNDHLSVLIMYQYNPSMLSDDISAEIEAYGGLQKWMELFDVRG